MADASRHITVALCTSVVSFDGMESNIRTIESAATTHIRRICEEAAGLHGCEVTSLAPEQISTQVKGKHEFSFSVTISGGSAEVASTRGFLLRSNLTQ
ncbi:hypothetical protein HDU67_006029, partial [Dinochytrium kinnereticum]